LANREAVIYMDSAILEWLKIARVDIKNRGEGNDVKVKVLGSQKTNVYDVGVKSPYS
jgi:hypothetical protein